MQIQRPPLPFRLKIVAILLILSGFYPLSGVLNSRFDLMVIILAIECVCGVGILRLSALARRIAVMMLWIVAILFVLAAVIYFSSGVGKYFRVDANAGSILAYGVLIAFAVLPFWMLRVLLDRRMDPLFDPRLWVIDRSDVFE